MSSPTGQRKCAVYTRRSRDQGPDYELTSLEAQHVICSAYIRSQAHKGWIEVDRRYEDAAQSGATLERPGMQELLADVERGRIDVVVVYKLDRLSRSLLDFVRLLDVFQRYGVSFACITQNFDTADSLGRLVMNILLTFAQFEREMTGDRIRDKRRAMAMKGLWSGGHPPLGYDIVKKRLVVNAEEAKIVRFIFEAYTNSGNLTQVAREADAKGYRSKIWTPRHGITTGGRKLLPVYVRHALRNPVYAGFVQYEGKQYEGSHQAIISRQLWNRVRDLRAMQIAKKARAPKELLSRLLYDCYGRSMTATRLLKRGKLHLSYRSNQSSWGERHGVRRMRVRAFEIEGLILSALQDLLCDRERLRAMLLDMGRHGAELALVCRNGPIASRRIEGLSRDQLRSVLHGLIIRIEVARERVKVVVRGLEVENLLDWDTVGLFWRRTEDTPRAPTILLDIPCVGSLRLQRFVRLPIVARKPQTYRINKSLRRLIVDARNARSLVEDNRDLEPAEIARRFKMGLSHLMRLIRLNYLAPDIVASILDGAQPRELTRRQLIDANLPLDWALQRKMFGFPQQPPMRTVEKPY
jgi:DNA invertase Pin-like site-specific DNA recombinase